MNSDKNPETVPRQKIEASWGLTFRLLLKMLLLWGGICWLLERFVF